MRPRLPWPKRMDRKTTSDDLSPSTADIPTDPDEIAAIEAVNALRQFDRVVELIDESIRPDADFKLRPSLVSQLNKLATEGTYLHPGVLRFGNVTIRGSKHDPPPPDDVPLLIDEMCEYVNNNPDKSPIHLAAYLLWRINWIHPYGDGNGRTARATSYLVLSIRLGFRVPGANTIPEQIQVDKQPYYVALEAADAAYRNGKIDVSELEALLGQYLATQLLDVHNKALGG